MLYIHMLRYVYSVLNPLQFEKCGILSICVSEEISSTWNFLTYIIQIYMYIYTCMLYLKCFPKFDRYLQYRGTLHNCHIVLDC